MLFLVLCSVIVLCILFFGYTYCSRLVEQRRVEIQEIIKKHSSYYLKAKALRLEYPALRTAFKYDETISYSIHGDRNHYNLFVYEPQYKIDEFIMAQIEKRNVPAFDKYEEFLKRNEDIEKFTAKWNNYKNVGKRNNWDDLHNQDFISKLIPLDDLYNYENELILDRLHMDNSYFVFYFNVRYVTPGYRDVRTSSFRYNGTEFENIYKLKKQKTEFQIEENIKKEKLKEIEDKKKSEAIAIESEKKTIIDEQQQAIIHNQQIIQIADAFDKVIRKHAKDLLKELMDTKEVMGNPRINSFLELEDFKKRFKVFISTHTLERKALYKQLLIQFPVHKNQIRSFTKTLNFDVDEMNKHALNYVVGLTFKFDKISRKPLTFCEVRSFSKSVRDALRKQEQELNKDTTITINSNDNQFKSRASDGILLLRKMYPDATLRWEHEFDNYDVHVQSDFVGVPFKDSSQKYKMIQASNNLRIPFQIFDNMRFYNLSQFIMLKSSHMLQESKIANKPMVYIVYNKTKHMVYVGQASQGFAKRFDEHMKSYHNKVAHNGSSTTGSYMWNRDLLAGDDVYFSFITVNHDSNNPGYISMDSLEKAMIYAFSANDSNYGYNRTSGNGTLQNVLGKVV